MRHELSYSVYVLLSIQDKKHYTGISSNVIKRLQNHNAGKVKSTKSRRPFSIVYQEEVGRREEARKREKYFKSAAGRRYLREIIDNEIKRVGGSPA